MENLEIKRRQKKPAKIEIKKRALKIKKRVKKFIRICAYCKVFWESPRLHREKGVNTRLCNDCKKEVMNDTKSYCKHYFDEWITVPNMNCKVIRDSHSPVELKIKTRRKKKKAKNEPPPFKIQMKEV